MNHIQMIKKVNVFKRANGEDSHVNERYKYFHDYWNSCFTDFNFLLVDSYRFDSHRTLILRTEHQIKFNFDKSHKYFKKYFLDHEFFSTANVIANRKSIQQNFQRIQNLVCTKNSYRNNIADVEKYLFRIKRILFVRTQYFEHVLEKLISVLAKDAPVDGKFKKDIRFLSNALIIELYHEGFGEKYIRYIPDIILFQDKIKGYPFEKKRSYFDSESSYREYIKSFDTLPKRIRGLKYLFNAPKNNGYIIFRIQNLELPDIEKVKVGDVEFYNPKDISHISNSSNEWLLYEDFTSRTPIGSSARSKCNVIVPIEFKFYWEDVKDELVVSATEKCQMALQILNRQLRHFSKYTYGGKVDPNTYFVLNENKTIYTIQRRSDMVRPDMEPDELEYFRASISNIRKLDLNTTTGLKVFNVISKCDELRSKHGIFAFKDLWIAWESLYKKNDLVRLFQAGMCIYFSRAFLAKIKITLSTYLSSEILRTDVYELTDKEKTNIGLNFEMGAKIPVVKFRRNYELLSQYLPGSFTNDLVQEIKVFLNNSSLFYDNIDKWVQTIVDDIYVERNMEVHSDLKNEFSRLRLTSLFLMMTEIAISIMILKLKGGNYKLCTTDQILNWALVKRNSL